MTKDDALEKKAENARELGLDYEPVIAQDKNKKESAPTKEWWASFLSPPVDCRKLYGDALEFDSVDRYYMAMQRQIDKEKNK